MEVMSLSHLPSEQEMLEQLKAWCLIESGTYFAQGIQRQSQALLKALVPLGAEIEIRDSGSHAVVDDEGRVQKRPLGPLIIARKRPQATRQVLLGIHYDTVYGESLAAGELRLDHTTGRLIGPGVADAKGGIVIMLAALRALESHSCKDGLGWELFLNSDEEVGSPSSQEYLKSCQGRFDFAMLFEPALPDGRMPLRRKGSGNFTWVIRGKAAHAGRDFSQGRNAVAQAARLATDLDQLNGKFAGSTFNVGSIVGGGAFNVVPDLCLLRLNVRVDDHGLMLSIREAFDELRVTYNKREGFGCELHGDFTSPPKVVTPATQILADYVQRVGDSVHQSVQWTESGGVCDGNKLAAVGVPTIDTFGPRGGELHSDREWMEIGSLVPRALFAASVLLGHARGEIDLSRKS